jgi:hypothetical protein
MREKDGKRERGVGLERRRDACRERERERERGVYTIIRETARETRMREPLSRMVPERKP